jgi:uncharacterized protein (TIGR00251 family)
MTPSKHRLHDGRSGSALAVRVAPRASRNRIAEVLSDGTVKIQLTAAPVEAEANKQLVEFLAKILKVPKSNLEIVAGATGRNKLITVLGMDAATLHALILSQVR